MTRFLKITDGVDIGPLLVQLEAHPELWDAQTWRKKLPGGPHRQMSDIWVRYNDARPFEAKGDFRGFNNEHESVWYPAYERLPALKGIIFPLMALVEGERLGGVLITRIPPGCGIGLHRDGGWHVEHYDKFYVSLKSSPGANFCSGDEVLCPKVGEVYRFDNRLEHWVENKSSEDRMTLIVCIRTRKFDERGHVLVAETRRAA